LHIIKEGELGASDSVQIMSRPDHGVTVSDVADAYLFDHRLFPRLLKVPQLRSDWHHRARKAGLPKRESTSSAIAALLAGWRVLIWHGRSPS
jgi:MOSC domain-containing protein YiiM